MLRELQLQADVGTLGLQGLGAFTSILATLSADNVAPMALIQMERLGAAFPTNGEYAERTKGLLQRCSDVRLNHLALVVGWRKNDSASLMAESAGGQAIALLAMCLTSLFNYSGAGTIFARLCAKLLSHNMNVSSIKQLTDVVRMLAGKPNALGFGNQLAKDVTKIHQVYKAMGKLAPKDLLAPLTVELAVDLLESLAEALSDDAKVCRISGSSGMGHILGLIQWLFPRSVVLTVENTIIQDVEHPKIRCEIARENGSCALVSVSVETIVSMLDLTGLPNNVRHLRLPSSALQPGVSDMQYHYAWPG